jgi:hypothetical protein
VRASPKKLRAAHERNLSSDKSRGRNHPYAGRLTAYLTWAQRSGPVAVVALSACSRVIGRTRPQTVQVSS